MHQPGNDRIKQRSQKEEDKYHMMLLILESFFKNATKRTYLQNRNRLTDVENKLTVTKGERRGRNKSGVWD